MLKQRLQDFWKFIQRESLDRLLLVLIALILLGSLGMMAAEGLQFYNAAWWSIVTLTTVGYGDIAPQSVGGRLIGIVLMVVGIGLLGMFTATIAGVLVERKMQENKGLTQLDLNGHIILCEWNHRARSIIDEIRSDPRMRQKPLVLIADLEEKPLQDEALFFVNGKVMEESLQKACIRTAETVVVLGDDRLEANARDAQVVLAALTIESIQPQAYTIVELVHQKNAEFCQKANADEIIIGSEFNSRLMARAAMEHGISEVISEILSARFGNDLQKIPVPVEMAGQTFLDVFLRLKKEKNYTVLAFQRGAEGAVTSNPAGETRMEASDYLVIIAPQKSAN